jgi:CubicO group peptidase (beta-lactamase class C family)
MNPSFSLRFVALLPVLTAGLLSAQGNGRSKWDEVWEEFTAQIHADCSDAGIVGAGCLAQRDGRILGEEYHGFRDPAAGLPVDQNTVFHWASITKTFTGVAVMHLRDRGLLSLDDAAVKHVPELIDVHCPFGDVSKVTLRHLLSHSAGFRGRTWPWGGDQPWHPFEPPGWNQLVAMMPYTEVAFEPGTRYSYSNPGLVFLGRTIERLTGEPFEAWMEKNLLRPLGMTRSFFDQAPWHLRADRSRSFTRTGSDLKDLLFDFDTGITVSNGGLNAPLPDMAHYLAFLLGAAPPESDAAKVLARSSLREMWQGRLPAGRDGKDQMGLCFFVHDRQGSLFYTHTGGQKDFVTFFYVHPESGTGALGACNTGTAGPVLGRMRERCMERLSLAMRPR